jgi:hypothetical protein
VSGRISLSKADKGVLSRERERRKEGWSRRSEGVVKGKGKGTKEKR